MRKRALSTCIGPRRLKFILARPDNPKLPYESIDHLFVCNTYHHLDERTKYFLDTKSSLKPGGCVVSSTSITTNARVNSVFRNTIWSSGDRDCRN